MLFVTLCRVKAGSTFKQRLQHRVQFQYPEGMRTLAEYWLATEDPSVVVVSEGDTIAPILTAVQEWDDVFDISVFPAITAEEGIAAARQAAGD